MDNMRIKIEAELAIGKTPKYLAEKYSRSYGTILSWQKKLNDKNTDVDTVVAIEPEILHAVAARIKEDAPKRVAQQIDKIVDGVTSLQSLEPKFHAVVLNLLERAETLSQDKDLTIKDWALLGTGIGQLYTNIFNKTGVNVNVLNNTQVNGEKMQLFKSSLSR